MIKKFLNNNHFHSMIGVAGGAGMAFLSFAFLARELSKNEFGKWALFLTAVTFVDMIKAGAVQSPLIKFSSGLNESEKQRNYSTSWIINIGFTLTLLLFYVTSRILLGQNHLIIQFTGYYLIYSITSMPFFYASWIANLELNFKTSTFLRIISASVFFIGLVLTSFSSQLTFNNVALVYSFSFLVASLIALGKFKTGIQLFKINNKYLFRQYFNFARYHIFAYLGSNLLKSFDTFIISILMGPAAVAFYNIPLRLVEVIELPLKSALNVGFPKFSGLHNQNRPNELIKLVGSYIGVLTVLYIPFMALMLFFSEELIILTAGEKYIEATPIFQIFVIYGLIIPFDRITGVVLDAIGKPKLNSRKVFFMALTNIIGDIIVLSFFDSLELVAVVTVINVIVGAVIGYYLISKSMNFHFSDVSFGLKIKINFKKHIL